MDLREVLRQRLRRLPVDVGLLLLVLVGVHLFQTRSHVAGVSPQADTVDLAGRSVRLGGSAQGVTVLHFWASWCSVCRAEEASVVALARSHRVIGIASRSGGSAEVERYVQDRGLPFSVVVDSDGSLAERFGVRAFPSTFFLDDSGRIVTSETGYTTELGLRARVFLAELRGRGRAQAESRAPGAR